MIIEQTVRITVLRQGSPIDGGDLTALVGAGVIAGGVVNDASQSIQRRLEVEFTDALFDLVPRAFGDLLAPPNEILVEMGSATPQVSSVGGVLLPGPNVVPSPTLTPGGTPIVTRADVLLEPVFVGGISAPAVDDTGDNLTVRITAFDRTRRLQRRWPRPFRPAPGMTVDSALRAGIVDRYPTARFGEWEAVPDLIRPDLVWGVSGVDSNPWLDLRALAEASGLELTTTAGGRFTLRPVVDPLTAAVSASYVEGLAGATLTGLGRSFSDEPGYNGVIGRAVGDHLSGGPLYSEDWDDDEASPTFRFGDWGEVPRYWVTPLATSQDQLDRAVHSLRLSSMRTIENVRITALPDPYRTVNEVSQVTRLRAGVDGRFLHRRVTLPLGGEAMTIEMAEKATAA